MGKCSVLRCESTKFLFKLPKKKEIRMKWLDFLVSSGKEVHENVLYCVCEKHFLPPDLNQCEKLKKLKSGAVPSVLIPIVSLTSP